MTLLLSGATGFLGSSVLAQADGHVAAVVRGRDWERRGARLRRLDPEVECVPGDVRRPLWGLDEATLDRLAGSVDVVVNVAAETSWAAGWPRLEATNVDGAAHGVDVAARLGARLVHVSSLYVGYEQAGEVHPRLHDERALLSRYERSKCRGEWAVVDRCRAQGVPARIVRVGTLIGDGRAQGVPARIIRVGTLIGDGHVPAPNGQRRRATAQVPFLRILAYLPKQGWRFLPHVEGARLDTMPRDVAARAVIAHTRSPQDDELEVHQVALGQQAPMVSWVLSEVAASLRRLGEPSFLPVRVPTAVLRTTSSYADRFGTGPRASGYIGMRYLAGRSVYLGDTVSGAEVTLGALRTALGLDHAATEPHSFYAGWMQ